ncbi:AraC family transcriptional regulator [uncultured Tateyamaria sp.]|uniref:helix-turn-helix transcriptional regulator n=1 Tax=uncultured Tateyamaria sp. TaxID=455651 RepID=UPI002624352F|nr:AraC family transcriptional regulator [uncultured Tateyamaria sp.]
MTRNLPPVAGYERCSVSVNPDELNLHAVFVDRNLPVSCARFTVGDHEAIVPADDKYDLTLQRHANGHVVTRQDNVEMTAMVHSGVLGFSTANTNAEYAFQGRTQTDCIAIHKDVFAQVIQSDIGFDTVGDLEPRFGWHNPRIAHLILLHFEAMMQNDLDTNIESETLGLMVASEVLRTFSKQKRTQTDHELSQRDLKTITDFVEGNLESNIDLSMMASVLKQDVFRFSKAFKAATGASPHQFVIGRRLHRATEYLMTSDMPLSEVAYACGFSSQAHMTSTFTKQLGETPGGIRRKSA